MSHGLRRIDPIRCQRDSWYKGWMVFEQVARVQAIMDSAAIDDLTVIFLKIRCLFLNHHRLSLGLSVEGILVSTRN